MMRLLITGLCCLGLLAGVGRGALAGSAASTPAPAAGATDENLIQLNFPETIEVKLLVDYVARRLGMNLLYDDAAVRKKVSILAPAKVPKDSLLGLLQSVLKVSGLAMVDGDQPGWKRIVPVQNLLAVTDKIERDPDRLATADRAIPMTQIFQLKHVTTAAIEPIIKPFLGTQGSNTLPIPDRRMVIVTDYAENLRRIAEVIDLFDRPAAQARIQFIAVENWDAGELAAQVSNLLRERQRAGGDKAGVLPVTLMAEPKSNRIVVIAAEGADGPALDLIRQLDVTTTSETRTYRFQNVSPFRIDKLARDFAGSDTRQHYKSTVDEQGGILVVTAAPHVHRHIANLARGLDVPMIEEEKPIRFYKLMNTTAAEVLATIQSIEKGGAANNPPAPAVTATAPSTLPSGWPGPNRPPATPGEEAPTPPAFKPPVEPDALPAKVPEKLKADDKIAGAQPGAGPAAVQVSRLREAIVTADPNTNTLIVVAPPPVQQVYAQLIHMLDKRRPQVMIEVTLVTLDTTDNFSFGVEIAGINVGPKTSWLVFSQFGLSTPDTTTGQLAIKPGSGLNGTVIDAGVISAVVRALATSGHARVVSAPKILVNDNATGALSSVAEAPFTSVNASSTVATTSFAGYASAGTTINVTPHISQGDHLLLNYSVTLNSFTGDGSAGVPPPRQTDQISSIVTIPDGNAIIIGGLTRKDLSETVSKVPLLGDLPGAGALFSNRSRTNSQTTLFVFLRPVILRDELFEDLRYLSDQALEKAGFPKNFPVNNPMGMN